MQRISEGQQRDLSDLLADLVEGEIIEFLAIYGAQRNGEDDYTFTYLTRVLHPDIGNF